MIPDMIPDSVRFFSILNHVGRSDIVTRNTLSLLTLSNSYFVEFSTS